MQPVDIIVNTEASRSSRDFQHPSDVVWVLLRGGTGIEEQQIVIDPTPFSVGRRPGSSMQLNYKTVSGNHAELFVQEGKPWIRDLSSTNGTYVNGNRIDQPTELDEEDLIQFADVAFRLRSETRSESFNTIHENMCDQALALVQFDRLMESRLVTPFYQPIINFRTEQVIGYEVLARSRLFGLESCASMFEAAERLNMELELSRMLRMEGVRQGIELPEDLKLFVNTHPIEVQREGLIESMRSVRGICAHIPLVLEVHEAAVTDPNEMRELRSQLTDLGIGLAYDDFGAGQTRLGELIEAPPDYLKFDISMIRGIDSALPERQKMLASLVSMVIDLGINPLAEGVETEGEATVCRQLGFESVQGFYFGYPAPLSQHLPGHV